METVSTSLAPLEEIYYESIFIIYFNVKLSLNSNLKCMKKSYINVCYISPLLSFDNYKYVKSTLY